MVTRTLMETQALIENVLMECLRFYERSDIRLLASFDRIRNQYLLLEEGWEQYKRIHFILVHIEILHDKVYIQRDGTRDGIAEDLVRAGIPPQEIVLAFRHPTERTATTFALA
jgi:hypothetical protein